MFSFGKPSPKKFASQLLGAIKQVNPAARFEFDADNFRFVRLDEEGEVNLTNIYAEHCSLSRKDRKNNLLRLATVFAAPNEDLPEVFEEAKPHLRPKIWNRSTFAFHELERRIKGGDSLDMPLYPLGSHLYSSLVFDTEHAMRSLSNDTLESWGATYYEALEVACQNLDESTLAFAKIGDNFHSAMSGDNYDSSRVLLLDRIRSYGVVGDPVAVVPQRDALFIAGSQDEASLSIMFDLTQKTMEEDPRPLCPLPLVLRDGEWVDWEPPRNHALRPRFDEIQASFYGGLYHEQKEILDAVFEHEGEDLFVASYSGVQPPGSERVRSYCVWVPGADSLLPRSELVLFPEIDGEGIAAVGEWDHVADVVGDLLVEDASYYPVRYRVREWPSPAQLAEIGKMDLE